MTKVMKVIFRLDYDISPNYLREFPNIFGIFFERSEKWTNYGINQNFAVNADYFTEHSVTQLNVEPVAAAGFIEWKAGLPIDRVFASDEFHELSRHLDKLVSLLGSSKMRRCGIRLQFAALGRKLEWMNPYFKQINEHNLGRFADVGLVLEGKHEDGVLYRVQTGPLERRNLDLTYARPLTDEQSTALLTHTSFIDMDMFEVAFQLAGRSFAKWASTKLDRMKKLVLAYEKLAEESNDAFNNSRDGVA